MRIFNFSGRFQIQLTPLFLILLLPLLFFTGCRFFSSQQNIAQTSLTINLPQWPPTDYLETDWPELSRWKITIVNSDFEDSYFTTDSTVIVNTQNNRPFCLIAQPLTKPEEHAFFKPAGFIYPWNAAETCNATWEQGFLSDIMAKLFCDGRAGCISPEETEYLVTIFNWNKAQSVIEKKIEESRTDGASDSDDSDDSDDSNKSSYNPWFIDYNSLLENLTVSKFKQSLLNVSGCVTVSTSLIGENQIFSSFIPENSVISKNKQLTVRKKTQEIFALGQGRGILLEYKSAKNISLELIFLPIYIEDI